MGSQLQSAFRRLILSLAIFGLLLSPAVPALAAVVPAAPSSVILTVWGNTSPWTQTDPTKIKVAWTVTPASGFSASLYVDSWVAVTTGTTSNGSGQYTPMSGTHIYFLYACTLGTGGSASLSCTTSNKVSVTYTLNSGTAPTASPTARPTLAPVQTATPSVKLGIGSSSGLVTAEIANGGSVMLVWSAPPSQYGYNVGIDETGGPYRAAQPGSSSLAIDSLATGIHTFKLSACSQGDPCLNSNSVTVTVDPPPATAAPSPCVRHAPTMSAAPVGNLGAPGGTAQFDVKVTDNDSASCSTTTYSLTVTGLPTGVTPTHVSNPIGQATPGVTNLTTVEDMASFAVGAKVPMGTYPLTFKTAGTNGNGSASAAAMLTVGGISTFEFGGAGDSLGIVQGQGVYINWSSAGLPVGGYFILTSPNLSQTGISDPLPMKLTNTDGNVTVRTVDNAAAGNYAITLTGYDGSGHALLPASAWTKLLGGLTIASNEDVSTEVIIKGRVIDSSSKNGLQATIQKGSSYLGIDNSGNYSDTRFMTPGKLPKEVSVDVSYPGYADQTVKIPLTPATATAPAVYLASDTLLVKNTDASCAMLQLDLNDPDGVLKNARGIMPIGVSLGYSVKNTTGTVVNGTFEIENGIPLSMCENIANANTGNTLTINPTMAEMSFTNNLGTSGSIPLAVQAPPPFVIAASGLTHISASIVPNKIPIVYGTVRDQFGSLLSDAMLNSTTVQFYDNSKASGGIWPPSYRPTTVSINRADGTYGDVLPGPGTYTARIANKIGETNKPFAIVLGSNGPDDLTVNISGTNNSASLVVIPIDATAPSHKIIGAAVTVTDKNGNVQTQKTSLLTDVKKNKIGAAQFDINKQDYDNGLYRVSIAASGFQLAPTPTREDMPKPGIIESTYELHPDGDNDCNAKVAGTYLTVGGTTLCFMDLTARTMYRDPTYNSVWQALGTEAANIQSTTGYNQLADHIRIYGDKREINAGISNLDPGKRWVELFGGLIDAYKTTPSAIADVMRHETGHQFESLVLSDGYGGNLHGNLTLLFAVRDRLYNDIKTNYRVIFGKETDSLYNSVKPFGGHPWENAGEDFATSIFMDNLYPGHYRNSFQTEVDSLENYPPKAGVPYTAKRLMQSKITLESCFIHPNNITPCLNLP